MRILLKTSSVSEQWIPNISLNGKHYITSASLFPKLMKDAWNGLPHGTQQMRQILCVTLHVRSSEERLQLSCL